MSGEGVDASEGKGPPPELQSIYCKAIALTKQKNKEREKVEKDKI